jgi:2-hydroxychromene-2-carboxylate isomerase
MGPDAMNDADINFYFDPLCPFAWMTSKWVRQVAAQRDYTVDWRFISLRMINANVDYDSRFPAGYEAGHTAAKERSVKVCLFVESRTGKPDLT